MFGDRITRRLHQSGFHVLIPLVSIDATIAELEYDPDELTVHVRDATGAVVLSGSGWDPRSTPDGRHVVAIVCAQVVYSGPAGEQREPPGETITTPGWSVRWGYLIVQHQPDRATAWFPIWVDLPIGFGTDEDWLVEWDHFELETDVDRVTVTTSFEQHIDVPLPVTSEIRLCAPVGPFDVEFDERAFRLELLDDRRIPRFTFDVPRPSGGYGGHRIVIAPDRRHVALHLYTGQSEQGWELFALEPTPAALPGYPVDLGEGHTPVFTLDSRALVSIVHHRLVLIGPDDATYDVFDVPTIPEPGWTAWWGTLLVQSLPDARITESELLVELPVGAATDTEWAHRYVAVRPQPDALALELPWGGARVVVPFPPPRVVRVPLPPNAR